MRSCSVTNWLVTSCSVMNCSMTKQLDERLLNDKSHDFERCMPQSLPLPVETRAFFYDPAEPVCWHHKASINGRCMRWQLHTLHMHTRAGANACTHAQTDSRCSMQGSLTSNLGHISRLGGACALELDTGLLLNEGNEALLVAPH